MTLNSKFLFGWFIFATLPLGCSLTISSTTGPKDLDSKTNVVSERAPAEEIWKALGRAIEAKTIGTSSRLAQFVVVLARNGDLSSDDVVAFDLTFPGIATADRNLTDDDINCLRSIKSARRSK